MGRQVEECKKIIQLFKDLVQEIGEDKLTNKIKILCGIKTPDSPVIRVKEEGTAELEGYALGRKNYMMGLIWVLWIQRKEKRKVIRKTLQLIDKKNSESYKPLGERLNAELELWYACIAFIDEFKLPELITFNDPIDGWFATTRERMSGEIPNNTKENQIVLLREEIQQLKNGINPHNLDKGEMELFNLINLVITIKTPQKNDNNILRRKRKEFRDESWATYIKAHQKWYRYYSTSKEIKAVFIEDDVLKYYVNGRQKRCVNPLLKENPLFRKKIKSLNVGSV
jgi:hypothetical protein